MKNKMIIAILTVVVLMTGCGSAADNQKTETVEEAPVIESTAEESVPEETEDASMDDLEALGDIEVEQNLFTVELTIPKDYVGETTQEKLDATAEEKGYKSITLNADGSATYVMTKKQHQEMMAGIEKNIDDSLAELVGSEDYPNFTDVKANDDYTSFTITTKSTELGLNESFSVMMFYMYGGMYHIFNGTTVDNIHIDFVNADSGQVINTADSKDIGSDSETTE